MALSPHHTTWLIDGVNWTKANWRAWCAAVESALENGQGGNPNFLINGDFQINQRVFAGGAVAAGVYTWDRWKGGAAGANATLSGYTLSLVDGAIDQVVEPLTAGVASFANLPVTISVEAPSHQIAVTWGNVSGTIPAGSGRQNVTLTSTAAGTSTLRLDISAGATAGTFGRVKAELGSIATPWAAPDRTTETLKCQRYFFNNATVAPANNVTTRRYNSSAKATTFADSFEISFPVRMRASPTITLFSSFESGVTWTAGRWQLFNGAWLDSSATIAASTSPESTFIRVTPSSGALTLFGIYSISGVMTASAEL